MNAIFAIDVEKPMKNVTISRTRAGQWFYAVYIDGRAVVVGMSDTREGAEAEARQA